MEKKIRRKFIKIAMISMMSVLFTLIAIINIINYNSIMNDANRTLYILEYNNGQFPEKPAPDEFGTTSPRGGMEKPFSERYFTVDFSENGKVINQDTKNIAAITDSEAITLAKRIYSSSNTTGISSEYKYQVTELSSGKRIIFLDIADKLAIFKRFLIASFGISFLGIILVFLLVNRLSLMVIKPLLESSEKQRRFITDASHELKTPLAIIQANNDVMLLENGESEWTKSNQKQIERLNSLTEKLIFLSRMDEDNDELLTKTSFNLSDAIYETVDGYRSLAKSQNRELSINIEEGITYTGDEGMIRRLTSLLLDNAIKYSNDGGSISVSLSNTKKPHLQIENTVENITVGEHPEFFERFYRGDKSRNSKSKGFGIGLSVVEAIARSHKARIKAYSPTSKKISFDIIF